MAAFWVAANLVAEAALPFANLVPKFAKIAI
jgi:hypothetical protein